MLNKLRQFFSFLKRLVLGRSGSKEPESVTPSEAESRAKEILRKAKEILRKAQQRKEQAIRLEKEVKRHGEKLKKEKASFKAELENARNMAEEDQSSSEFEEEEKEENGSDDVNDSGEVESAVPLEDIVAEAGPQFMGLREAAPGVSVLEPQEAETESPPSADIKGAVPDQTPEVDSPRTTVVIGLDFGTSCCKVVMRAPYFTDQPAYPVKFDILEDENCPFLVPTEIYRSPKGEFRLEDGGGCERIDGLKVSLMDRPEAEGVKENAVGYLALVMKYAKSWFRENQTPFASLDLDWEVNVGIPSDGSDDDDMRQVFQQVAEGAWELSEDGAEVTLDSARKVLDRMGLQAPSFGTEFSYEPNEGISDSGIDHAWVEPTGKNDLVKVCMGLREEVVGAAQGYIRSHQAKLGLHVMVDVGATTLDICGFQLGERDNEPFQALLVTRVERLGVDEKDNRIDEDGTLDPEFRSQCIKALHVAMDEIEDKARNEPAFKRGEPLPMFLCGGGGQDPFYREVIDRVDRSLKEKKSDRFGGISIERIPEDSRVEWPDEVDQELYYHRIAVAFGLSFTAEEVGGIKPPSCCDDIEPPDEVPPERPVGPEQV